MAPHTGGDMRLSYPIFGLQNYHWVGTGRVALRYVSPCPPLDPYVRLSPHTAHDRGILWERSISPTPRNVHRGQLGWVGARRVTLRHVSSRPPFSTGRAPLKA